MPKISDRKIKEMIRVAKKYGARAYAPYSGYRVGAAILASDGSVYGACNVENVSYGASTCAEQAALHRAVAEGKKKFLAIMVTASDKKRPVPCGICRQVLWELAGDLTVFVNHHGKWESHLLSELYPFPFAKQKK